MFTIAMPVLLASTAAGVVARRVGGSWPFGVRCLGTALAVLMWLANGVFHLPIAVLAVLAALYPLLACEPAKGMARRAALLAAVVVFCADVALGLAGWRYDVPGLPWPTSLTLMFGVPPAVGLVAWWWTRRGALPGQKEPRARR